MYYIFTIVSEIQIEDQYKMFDIFHHFTAYTQWFSISVHSSCSKHAFFTILTPKY